LFDDTPVKNVREEKLKVFNGVTDLIIINGNSKSDPNRLHLTAKTGRGSWSHCQLDGGSFVLDCDGERWGIDMGPDSYSLPNFWDYKPGGERYNYFRNTNQSHSTLTIDNKIQYADGEGTTLKSNNKSSQPFGIFDLSPYYPDEAVSLKRGFKLLGEKTLLMRDEVELKPHSKEISWRFVTNAEVRIDGNTAMLTQNGKTFYVRCLLPSGYTMLSFPAKPNSDIERPISGVNIVEIKLNPTVRSATIPVVFTNNISQFKAGRETQVELENWN
jgi:oligo-alginate lyase